MKAINNTLKSLLVLLLILTSAFADNGPREIEQDQSYGEVLRDIYQNGELDDRSIFMVLGFEQAKEFAGDIGSYITSTDDLRDIGVEIKDGGKDFLEILERTPRIVKGAAKYSIDTLKEVITAPKDTLSKIPTAFKVSMNYARAGYYESESEVIGGFKYAGHATWFLVKGSYYLLLEAPARAVLAAGFGAFAVPGAVVLNGIYASYKLVVGTANAAIYLSFETVKTVAAIVGQVATLAYSALSTTTVAVVTSVIALPVYIFQGIKNVSKLVSLKLIKSTILSSNLDLVLDTAEQSLKELAEQLKLTGLEMKFRRVGKTYRVYLKKGKTTLVRMKISTNRTKARFKTYFNRDLYRQLKEQGYDKESLNEIISSAIITV